MENDKAMLYLTLLFILLNRHLHTRTAQLLQRSLISTVRILQILAPLQLFILLPYPLANTTLQHYYSIMRY